MRRVVLAAGFALLSACSPVEEFAPTVSFGPVETVRVGGRDYAVREATDDPVLRSAFVAAGTDMGDAMVAGGMPRNGAYDYLDTIRVAGAEGRDVALSVIAAWCEGRGGVPAGLSDAVLRIDPATGEQVYPGRCAG